MSSFANRETKEVWEWLNTLTAGDSVYREINNLLATSTNPAGALRE